MGPLGGLICFDRTGRGYRAIGGSQNNSRQVFRRRARMGDCVWSRSRTLLTQWYQRPRPVSVPSVEVQNRLAALSTREMSCAFCCSQGALAGRGPVGHGRAWHKRVKLGNQVLLCFYFRFCPLSLPAAFARTISCKMDFGFGLVFFAWKVGILCITATISACPNWEQRRTITFGPIAHPRGKKGRVHL